MHKICMKCNKEFIKPINCSKKEWETRLYCSQHCANSINSSKNRLSDYVKENGAWNKGKFFYRNNNNVKKKCIQCNNIFEVRNYRKDTAKFCTHKCSTNFNYKGKTTENEYRKSNKFKIWRNLVYEKYDWTCQKCGVRGEYLNAHHIYNFCNNEEIRFDVNNGITFCDGCHKMFHKEFGYRNNNKEQIVLFVASAQEA